MHPTTFKRLTQLFEQARHLAPDEQTDFLALQCEEDKELLVEIRALLRYHTTIESPVDDSALGVAARLRNLDRDKGDPGRTRSHAREDHPPFSV